MHKFGTVSGRYVDPFNPRAEDIYLLDGLLAIARTPRFRGMTSGDHPRSVLEHSMMVAELIADKHEGRSDGSVAICRALLHDIGEWPFGDIPSPVKSHPAYEQVREAERKFHDFIVEDMLGLHASDELKQEIERADRFALLLEASCLAGASMVDPHWEPIFRDFDALMAEFFNPMAHLREMILDATNNPPNSREIAEQVFAMINMTISAHEKSKQRDADVV